MGKDQVPLSRVGVPTWVSDTVDLKYIAVSKMLFIFFTLPYFLSILLYFIV